MFAEVIVNVKYEQSLAFYDYIIPESFRPFLVRGMRVVVPFQHQTLLGVVLDIKDKSELATKELVDVLDAYPSVSEEIFFLAEEIKKQSNRPFARIFYEIIPKELLMNFQKVVYRLKPLDDDLLESKFNQEGIWRLKKIDQMHYPKLKRFKEQGLIDIEVEVKNRVSPKYVTYYAYQSNHTYKRALNELEIIHHFEINQSIKRQDLIEMGLSASRIKQWLKHDVIKEEKVKVRREIHHVFKLEDKKINLTEEQINASNHIKSSLFSSKVFLLKGVTGSGKTEVYMNVMEEVIKQGKKILILVPEIMQVPQMIMRLKSKFQQVAIYHSALSKGEAFDEFERILHGEADIICGTRSAIFLPIEDLGMIIMDEEHDPSYIQTEGVYYDTKELAISKSKLYQIPLILGSATPKIETMYAALHQKIELITLNERHQGQLPKLSFIDMKEELKQKNTSILSNELKQKIQERLNKHEQIILLYNKKGYAPYVLCRDCGYVPKCPHCEVSLTLYKSKNILKCHYCGYEETYDKTCKSCSNHQVKEVGIGIEYVESHVKKVFPEAKVLRLDKEMTKTKNQHEIIYTSFKEHEADILIGTQMVSKGLDFEHVTLVGIILADASFRVPAYDSDEQAYMLFTQVSGRSGRHQKGEVVIQAYQLEHQTLRWLKKGYDTFYQEVVNNRKLLNYPPFSKISTIIFEGPSLLKTYQEAFRIKKNLLEHGFNVLGPAEALAKKIKDQFRYSLTIKHDERKTKHIIDLLDNQTYKDVFVTYYPSIER